MKKGFHRTDNDIEDLDRLTHWHPDFLKWKTWDEVPEVTRELVADFLRVKAQSRDATASRIGGRRPNQTRFETMWAHVMRLAASHLFDPSLSIEEEDPPCQSDDAAADA